MKKLLLLVNTHSGRGDIQSMIGSIIDYYNKNDFEVTVYITQRRAHATDILLKNKGVYDNVVCCGGDGTLNEVITGLMGMEKDQRPIIGYIPCGSTNDFATGLGIKTSYTEAYKLAVDGNPFPIDIGKFNDSYFSYVAAFGMFTSISYETPQIYKNLLGYQAYVIEGIKQISKMESYNLRISYDDGIIEDEFILGIISNSNTVAGIKNLFKNDIQDGLFEVVLIKKPSNIANLSTIITALAEKKLDNPMMYHFKSRNFVFESLDNNGIKWTLDGEFGGVFTSAEIDVCPLEVTLNI